MRLLLFNLAAAEAGEDRGRSTELTKYTPKNQRSKDRYVKLGDRREEQGSRPTNYTDGEDVLDVR